MTRQKTSCAWSHFDVISPQQMRCSYCYKTCRITAGSTGNLIRHLRKKHPEILENAPGKESSKSKKEGNNRNCDEGEGSFMDEEEVQSLIQFEKSQTAESNHETVLPNEPQELPSLVTEQRKKLPLKKKSTRRHKRSAVWSHFTETDTAQRMQCSHCKRICSISYGSTGNLMRHMRMRHPKIAVEIEGSEIVYNHKEVSDEITHFTPIQNGLSQTVPTITGTISIENPNQNSAVIHSQPVQYYVLETMNENYTMELNKQLLKMIVKDLNSLNIVENPEFKKFVGMLNQTHTLPSYKDLKEKLLPQVYETTVNELKSTLMEVTAAALTTDQWTSIKNERYISITAHYLNKNCELKSNFLSCSSFTETHSSSDIAHFLKCVVEEWGLSDKVVAVVTHNIPSMISAVEECKWLHVSCFASKLNKIVEAGLIQIKPVIENIRQVVKYFKANASALEKFKHIQNEIGSLDIRMKVDTPSRWNTTFEMIARFCKNKEPLLKTIDELQLDCFKLSTNDWIVMEKAVRLLIIFNSVTVEMSSEDNFPLSKVPHMVRSIMKHVSNILEDEDLPSEIKDMTSTYNEELQKYYQELKSNTLIGQNVLLDPRFKKRGFPDDSFHEAYTSLCNQIISLKTEKIDEIKNSNKTETETENNTKKSEFLIDLWCEFKESEPVSRNNATAAATSEIGTFLNDEYLSLFDSPLVYWGNLLNQSKFPTVFELVKRRLCVPATAIPGQKIYTKDGDAYMRKRNCITSGKVKEILFLSHSL